MQSKGTKYQDPADYKESSAQTLKERYSQVLQRQLDRINDWSSRIGDGANDQGEIATFISSVNTLEWNLWGYLINNNKYKELLSAAKLNVKLDYERRMNSYDARVALYKNGESETELKRKFYDYPMAIEKFKLLMVTVVEKDLLPGIEIEDEVS